MKKSLLTLIVAAFFAVGWVLPTAVSAQEDNTDDTTTETTRQEAIKAKIAEIKARRDAKKLQIQQAACEKKEQILNSRIDHLTAQVKKHKGVFDKIYERVQAFKEEKNLTVADYDTLKAAADSEKTDAETAISALEAFVVEIDCSNPSVGEQLSGFKEAVTEARDALKAYRKAIVEFSKAVRLAAETAETTETTETEGEQ